VPLSDQELDQLLAASEPTVAPAPPAPPKQQAQLTDDELDRLLAASEPGAAEKLVSGARALGVPTTPRELATELSPIGSLNPIGLARKQAGLVYKHAAQPILRKAIDAYAAGRKAVLPRSMDDPAGELLMRVGMSPAAGEETYEQDMPGERRLAAVNRLEDKLGTTGTAAALGVAQALPVTLATMAMGPGAPGGRAGKAEEWTRKAGESALKQWWGARGELAGKIPGNPGVTLKRAVEAANKAMDAGMPTVGIGPAKAQEAASALKQVVVEQMAPIIPRAEEALSRAKLATDPAVNPDVLSIYSRIEKEITGPLAAGNPGEQVVAKKLVPWVDDILQRAGENNTLSLSRLNEYRQGLDKQINWARVQDPGFAQSLSQVRRVLNDEVMAKLESASQRVGDAGAAKTLQALKEQFGALKIVENIATAGSTRAMKRAPIGLSDLASGALGAAAGSAAGHGLTGAALAGLGSRLVNSFGPGLAAWGYRAARPLASGVEGIEAATPAAVTNPRIRALLERLRLTPTELAPVGIEGAAP
jgi:hypothetical protein